MVREMKRAGLIAAVGVVKVSRQPCGNLEMQTRKTTSWLETWRTSMRRWLSGRASTPSDDVDEIAREVFLRLLRYSDDVLVECPQDHLFRIAASVTNEWHERAQGNNLDDDAQFRNDPERRRAVQALANQEVREAVVNLPSQQREVLLLHVKEDVTYRQIAARKRLAPRVVRRDIVTAYTNLRYELRPTSWI